jgi:hypothetical protein
MVRLVALPLRRSRVAVLLAVPFAAFRRRNQHGEPIGPLPRHLTKPLMPRGTVNPEYFTSNARRGNRMAPTGPLCLEGCATGIGAKAFQ